MSLILKSSQDGTKAIIGVDGGEQFKVSSNGDLEIAGKIKSQSGAALTSDSPMVVEVNSSQPALRVTQTGSGNAIVIEDSANPDVTPFTVTADGHISIGTPSATASGVGLNQKIYCVGEGDVNAAIFDNFGRGSNGITTRSARGTLQSPSSILNGDRFAYWVGGSYGTTTFGNNPAAMNYYAAENHTNAAKGSYITFDTTSIGASSRSERMRIKEDGSVVVNNGFTSNNFFGKNFVTNGSMVIAQQSCGEPIVVSTPHSGQLHPIDRWLVICTGDVTTGTSPSATFQQIQLNPGEVPGQTHAMKFTVNSVGTCSAESRELNIRQRFEGTTMAAAMQGTSQAKTLTVSFWVKSNRPGLYSTTNRLWSPNTPNGYPSEYVSSYTINAANTWEYKTITIPPNTLRPTHNNSIQNTYVLFFTFDQKYSSQSTPGQWNESVNGLGLEHPQGMSYMVTPGAEWFLTGVQMEVGNVATSFERKPLLLELKECQRFYFSSSYAEGKRPGYGGINNSEFILLRDGRNILWWGSNKFPVTMRYQPAMTIYQGYTGNLGTGWGGRAGFGDYPETCGFLDVYEGSGGDGLAFKSATKNDMSDIYIEVGADALKCVGAPYDSRFIVGPANTVLGRSAPVAIQFHVVASAQI